jgi:hypothetical protein
LVAAETLAQEREAQLDDAKFLEECIWTLQLELEGTGRPDLEKDGVSVEKSAWASERTLFEQERGKWPATTTVAAGLEEKLEKERAMWEQEREELVEQAKDQIADASFSASTSHVTSANCFLFDSVYNFCYVQNEWVSVGVEVWCSSFH